MMPRWSFGGARLRRVAVAALLAGWLPLAAVLAPSPARAADAIAQLRAFVAATRSAEGEFEQTVSARSGRRPQQAAGRFAYARPGRFHWEYERPYRQLLVGDGSQLWTWDADLNQVTVRALGDALGATPAAILFGSAALEDNFILAEGGVEEGLAWVEAQPRQSESGFAMLRLGLAEGRLQRMEMRDHFGQLTTLRFIRLQANPALAAGQFQFTPPPGADVIGTPVAPAR